MKERLPIDSLNKNSAGKTVELLGWIDTIRDHGGVLFADLRNRSGKIQLVFDVSNKDGEFRRLAGSLRSEFVVSVKGCVKPRPEDSVNKKIPTGEVEVWVDGIDVLNPSLALPFYPGDAVSDETRLKYRFLDLRSSGMLSNLAALDKIMRITREYFFANDFIEVLTPLLTKSTPEGARDYLVPARMQKGAFFALPQSPQLFKQVLMSAGVERYYQIAKCFRDEDLRSDRQPEFTQIDMEMSFADADEVMETVRKLLMKIFSGFSLKLPEPGIIKYEDAIAKYGTDKPDLRLNVSPIENLTEIFKDTGFNVFKSQIQKGNKITSFFAERNFSGSELNVLTSAAKEFGAGGLVWIKKSGTELKSPVLKFFGKEEIERILKLFPGSGTIFACTGPAAFEIIGRMRIEAAEKFNLKKDGFFALWITEAPLFEKDKEGNVQATHHPFTAPIGDVFTGEAMELKSHSYDFVINGEEIGGGSVRIHNVEMQKRIFEILKIPEEEYNKKFGFLLGALSYGCPPHGGFAVGLERLAAMLLGLKSIRDVIAFPKTQNACCPLTGAPDRVSEKQLKDLGLKLLQD
ncbi:MAG: aspartate--tRNA ligase [bacterium]